MSTNLYPSLDIELNAFERQVAQRMMISVRYFCEQGLNGKKYCLEPVTKLPSAIADLIESTDLGGVVLFAENISDHSQVIKLTSDLQSAALKSQSQKPLFICIDQEGGRVVRLNRESSTAFSGNMAIGASYHEKGVHHAQQVGRVIGNELNALGINLNFSPDVDVNNNPDNPVINVRSFGEKPEVVSELGIAMMDAFQKEKVIATLKHFPGHGNTSIDSHTGLPIVGYDAETIYKTDLLPFKHAIEQSNPGMVMTAHIQYPNLDDTEIDTINGERIVLPATLSKEVLTNLLKDKMKFKGVVITDALNMAGISHHFNLEDATAISLLAGADVALMPFRIRVHQDVNRFKHFIKAVAEKMLKDDFVYSQMEDSLKRINALKNEYALTAQAKELADQDNFTVRVENAEMRLASQSHRDIQKQLAFDSVTLIKRHPIYFPISENTGRSIHVVVQDSQQREVVERAMKYYWTTTNTEKLKLTFTLLAEYRQGVVEQEITDSAAVILFYSERRESAVVKGEFDDYEQETKSQIGTEEKRLDALIHCLEFAKSALKPTLVAGMQSPYEMRKFLELADSIVVAYDASIYQDVSTNRYTGVTYDAVVATILGAEIARGQLPVLLQNNTSKKSIVGSK